MLDIPSVTGKVAALGVLVGVVFTVLELRNLVKTRRTDLIMRLHLTASSKEFFETHIKVWNLKFKDYNDYVKRYGLPLSENPANIAFAVTGMFYEGIGVLLHRKLVDIDLVYDLFPVSMGWEKMKPIVEGMRKEFNFPGYFEWFEYLYNEMQKREQRLQQIQQ